jgi:oligopeptide transport system substrate-binding protein
MTGQSDLRAGGAIFEGLTRYSATNGMPEPGLASRWDISPDGRRYVFHIREEARWSSGEPLTALDFLRSWLRILEPTNACEYAGILFYVKGAEAFHTGAGRDQEAVGFRAVTPLRFEIELKSPTPFFLDLCALPTLAAVPVDWIERHGDRWLTSPPVPASGAYQLEFWRVNDRIRLRRNPRYWDNARTRTDVIDLLPCANANTALNLYETRAVDVVWDMNLVPADLLDVLLDRPDFTAFPVLSTYFLRFNVTRTPFQDPRVRRAFGLAIDRERIVRRVTRGGELPTTVITPKMVPDYDPPEGLNHDPAAARRSLADAGFPEGRGFPAVRYLFDTTTRLQEQIAVELQAMWRETLGVVVELRQLEWKTYLTAQRELDYDLCRSSWIGDYNDPTTFLDLFLSNNGNNRTGWKHPDYDGWLRLAAAEVDSGRRAGILRQAENLLVREEAPVVPIFVYTGIEYFDPTLVHGIHPNPRAEHPLRAIARIVRR